ncbi:MAG: hypothetical protein JXA99_12890 [Candidatus Lokiarchaeota archaeon]|nr:hypothetical protein [Candidatus Lokiarchaeota archaeon]
MEKLDIEETISQLKKIFPNSTPSRKLYPITDEQKVYVRKLNILFCGFHDYLKNEKKLAKTSIKAILEDIETFLQIFHLDYSDKMLSEINAEEISYFLQDFLPRKWLDFSKNDLKSMCKSLKVFIGFLREKLHYYPEVSLFKKMMDKLNPNQLIKAIDWDDDDDDDDDIENAFSDPNRITLKFEDFINDIFTFSIEKGSKKSPNIKKNFLKLMETFRDGQEKEKRSEFEMKKKLLTESINLEIDLHQWYTIDEINVGKVILENVFKNIHNLENLNKKGLLAAIDYALSEIFSKKTTQSQIAKRYNTSPATMIKHRSIIAPCIPLEFFYPLFISEDDLKLEKEKTYIFKINNSYKSQDWSKFELAESNTLEDLHYAIQLFRNREDDEHLYSFFMNGKEWDRSSEYAGPPEYQQESDSKGTNITLKELNLGYKQRFLYLYDYGDCIKYYVTIIGLGIYNDSKTYPHQIK